MEIKLQRSYENRGLKLEYPYNEKPNCLELSSLAELHQGH